MFRRTPMLALCAFAAFTTGSAHAEVLVQTRYLTFRPIDVRGAGEVLDLREFFERHPGEGPVATFSIRLPEQDGLRTIDFGSGASRRIMTFKTEDGSTYESIFDPVTAADLVQRPFSFDVQLFPNDAPLTVANFITYARRGDFDEAIVHRSVSNVIVQSGGFRFAREGDNTEAPLWAVQMIDLIPMEYVRSNTPGTLAMARPAGGFASNQWFFNIQDNARFFSPQVGNPYAVFGEATPEGLEVLRELNKISLFDLTRLGGSFAAWDGTPMLLPFSALDYRTQLDRLITFDSVTVSEGTTEGITYAYEVIVEDDEGESLPVHPDSFDIRLEDGRLAIDTVDTGRLIVQITGAYGEETITFDVDLFSEDPRVRQFLGSAVTVAEGHSYSIPFLGAFDGSQFPWILHPRHHFLYVATEAQTERFHFFDNRLNRWIFVRSTRPSHFYIHAGEGADSAIGWVFFANQTGSPYDSEGENIDDRWFYHFAAETWVQGKDL